MTMRTLSLIAPVLIAAMLFVGGLVGCNTGASSSMAYPQPTFAAPRVMTQQQPPTYAAALAYRPTPQLPQINAPAMRPPVAQSHLLAGIPITWVPPVASRPWHGIVIHHSATTTGGAAAFDKDHRQKGWDELGYDFVIGNGSDTGNGQVEVGSRWVKQKIGAHAKSSDNRYNEYYIGICLVGNFDQERPTPQQIAALEKLVCYLMTTYHIRPDMIVGHNDTKQTDCPGKHLNVAVIRRDVTQMLGSRALQARSVKSELLTDVSR